MIVSKQWESLYSQIELVQGVGDRKRRKLCIMSFAAFLAGETHNDRPRSVSGLIRRYAVVINDEMPATFRQDLKPFAPRLLGTSDQCDYDRAALLLHILRQEVLPRIEHDFPASPKSKIWWIPSMSGSDSRGADVRAIQARLLSSAMPATDKECAAFAGDFAKLLSACARNLTSPSPNWYWTKAIETLDRLCDVRGERNSQEIKEESVAALVQSLKSPNFTTPVSEKFPLAFYRLYSRIPGVAAQ